MPAIEITVTGNLARDPDLKYTSSGAPVATFTIASTERYQENGEWKDGTTSWVRCNAWRDLAEHVAETFNKGDRVIVHGTLRQRDYEVPAKDGNPGGKRTSWEVNVTDAGPSLKYATVKVQRATRSRPAGTGASGQPAGPDPWASDGPGGYSDEPPF
jgi:single-strand DNA-binding protein